MTTVSKLAPPLVIRRNPSWRNSAMLGLRYGLWEAPANIVSILWQFMRAMLIAAGAFVIALPFMVVAHVTVTTLGLMGLVMARPGDAKPVAGD